jgi:hypothetical protein
MSGMGCGAVKWDIGWVCRAGGRGVAGGVALRGGLRGAARAVVLRDGLPAGVGIPEVRWWFEGIVE